MKTTYSAAIKRWRKRKLELGKRFRSEREAKGLTRAELADKTGLHYTTVHKLETGIRLPQMGTVILIAQALGKRPEEMLA